MFDHSNCGIGAIVNLDGAYSHQIIMQGMQLLEALTHRGGVSKDGTGDGCGILLQIPKSYPEYKRLLKENTVLREEIEQKTREYYGINLKKK